MQTKLVTIVKVITISIIDAIRGARFAKKSLGASDSIVPLNIVTAHLGPNDLQLAQKLAWNPPASAHDKFLQQVPLLVDIQFPRYMWQEFDTYRIGVSKQSESTMHTLTKDDLGPDDFELGSEWYASKYVVHKAFKAFNVFMDCRDDILKSKVEGEINETECREALKAILPESFLQWRRVGLNYAVLKTIYSQRISHRNKQWRGFLNYMIEETPYSNLWVGQLKDDK